MALRRNRPSYPLTSNGKNRHGQFDWHDENCLIEDYGITSTIPPYRAIWCATHGQWAHETPVEVSYLFENGEVVKKVL